jgi:hypothetical protein
MISYSRTLNDGVHALRLEEVDVVETDNFPLFTIARESSIKLIVEEFDLSEDVRLKLIIHNKKAYFELVVAAVNEEIETYWSSEQISYKRKACFNTVAKPRCPATSITFDMRYGKGEALTDRLEAMIKNYNNSIETELAMEREEYELLYHERSVLAP